MLKSRWRELLAATLLTVPLLAATPTAADAAAATLDQQVVVPAYFLPSGKGLEYWNQMLTAASKPAMAIANVANGPGGASSPAWAGMLPQAHNAGIKVIGYVDTGYFGTTGQTTRLGSTSIEDWRTQIQSDVNKWYAYYGSSIDGIFFDQAQYHCGPGDVGQTWADLYRDSTAYVKKYHPGATTIANPGVSPYACYQDTADILVTFEGPYSKYLTRDGDYVPQAWEAAYDPQRIWHLIYDVPDTTALATVMAKAKANNAGRVYATDDVLANPWDNLPGSAYMSAQITAAKGTGGAVPATPAKPTAGQVKADSLRLSWTSAAYPGVVGYDIYQGSTKIGTEANFTPSATTFDVGGLSAATAYSFTIKARDAAGNVSAASTALSVTTAAASATAPTKPGTPVASNVGPTSAKLTWTASTDPDSGDGIGSYEVYRNGVRELTVPGTVTSATVGGLAMATSYSFTVLARDTTGRASAQTAAVAVTTTNPAPITGATASATATTASYTAQFNLPYTSYHVFIDTDANYQTGWSIGNGTSYIGADYMIENSTLYQKTGAAGEFTWTAVTGVNPLVSSAGGLYKWSVPLSSLTGVGTTHNILFHGTDGTRNDYSNLVTLTHS
ncbi:fibronectin type III domain-containing protein [Nonomuraea sp. 3-1Str]|uniref:spherulation-specific family 4 protein n=1 Tax=Nonomuraea sp. 3-1Str TaxID=2929801 RepID=UPI0028594748|nr:spherulation-specific family 4 protein [Nonomuraea sp. 3-1Str]MDR8413063.1 fibronectin type III domain-containing protein [Nonomuraea sp. 3-1Str]